MLRAPKYVIEKGIVQGLIDSKIQQQQVGIDVTVKNVYKFVYDGLADFAHRGVIDFDNKSRKIPEVELIPWSMGNFIILAPGPFIVTSNEVFHFGNREFGHIYPRSSLNRCGASLESAVFDPCYEGSATVLLLTVHNPNGLVLHRYARVGQMIVFLTGFDADGYKGIYQGKTEVQNKVRRRK
jgi:dUTP pyrophosphatase